MIPQLELFGGRNKCFSRLGKMLKGEGGGKHPPLVEEDKFAFFTVGI